MVRGNPHLSEVVIVPKTRGLQRLRDDVRLASQLRRRHFDLAIDLHGGPRSAWLTWASGAPRRIGYTIKGRSWMYTDVVDRAPDLTPRHSVANQWDLLAPLGIAHSVLAWTGPKPASGLQDAARQARRALLVSACRAAGSLHLLLAHQRDDQAETVALRAAARSGPDGLAGISGVVETADLRILRPLLAVPHARLVATLRAEIGRAHV